MSIREQVIKIEFQKDLESKFDKNQALPRIVEGIKSIEGLSSIIAKTEVSEEFAIKAMAQMMLHRRCPPDTLIGIMRKAAGSCQESADMISQLVDVGLIKFDPNIDMLITAVSMDEQVQREIDQYQYPLPMIIEPKKLTNNKSSCYLTKSESILLKDNHHNRDVYLNNLNRRNAIPLSINLDTCEFVAYSAPLEHKEDESEADYMKRVKALDKYRRDSKLVYKILLDHGNKFYLGHKVDSRGRAYVLGYHINYQGTDYNKAIVELYNKEITLI